MAEQYRVDIGQRLQIDVQLRYATRPFAEVSGVYAGTETLGLVVWQGDDQTPATLTTSAATWVSGPNGQVLVTLTSADTANLTVGLWRLRVTITTGGEVVPAYEAILDVRPVSGSASPVATYCTFDDVLKVAPWVRRLVLDDQAMQGTLAEHRGLARQWLDRQLLSRVRRDLESQYERHAPIVEVITPEITTGLDAGPEWGPSIYPQADVSGQLETVRGLLSTNKLKTADGVAALIASYMATAYLCDSQLSEGDGPNYTTLAAKYRRMAQETLSGWTAQLEITTPQDATVDYELTP